MPHTQDTRLCRIGSSPLPENDLLVGRLSAVEAISRLFQIELDLLSPRPNIRPAELLGQPLQITIQLDNGKARFFHGFVSRFAQGGPEGRLFSYRTEVVPWMWFLSRNVDTRIFQDQSVPQILETIFKDHGFDGLFEITAPGASKPREYCVQYRESDLNFVSRLMEEEGLFYFFAHEEKKHKLIVSDGTLKLPELSPKAASLAIAESEDAELENWFAERELHSGTFGTAEFNVEERKVIASSQQTARVIAGNTKFEVFDFPSEQMKIDDSDRRALLRMEAEEASAARHSGSGTLPGFGAGVRFDLVGHFHDGMDQEYMLTTVHHSVSQEITTSGSSRYSNSFSAVRTENPFRPPLVTPKPIVQGPQTALVVGKDDRGKIDPEQKDDDIDVDELGRVLVKFHWDRSGPNAKRDSQKKHESSCRVRVSQVWSGKNWGAVFWPRIGQEVIVEFLEGDPDRPIITGSVYNGKYRPPYDLPANKTQSGFKTRSTPDGTPENFNEIRFEDKKGKEEIAIHAERNLSTSVEADESHSVGGNRSTTIKKDDTTLVENQRKTVVNKGNSQLTVSKGNHILSVPVGNYYADVPAKEYHVHTKEFWAITNQKVHLKAAAAEIMIQPAEIKLLVGGSTIEITPGGIKVTSSGPVEIKGATVKLN